ncbi:MAG: hypothetical protein JO141_16360 [Bradyrhizobium sp.]|nr:hypothetical protein [Bradyrhizobium sp.]
MNWSDWGLLADRQRPGALIVHLGLGLTAPAVVQSRAGFQAGANPHDERLFGLDAMDGKSRPQLPPPFPGEDAGMAHVFAAAIASTGPKREAQFEGLAVAPDVLDAQGIILVGTSFGASVLSEQVNPGSADTGLKGRVFNHERGAPSAAKHAPQRNVS